MFLDFLTFKIDISSISNTTLFSSPSHFFHPYFFHQIFLIFFWLSNFSRFWYEFFSFFIGTFPVPFEQKHKSRSEITCVFWLEKLFGAAISSLHSCPFNYRYSLCNVVNKSMVCQCYTIQIQLVFPFLLSEATRRALSWGGEKGSLVLSAFSELLRKKYIPLRIMLMCENVSLISLCVKWIWTQRSPQRVPCK